MINIFLLVSGAALNGNPTNDSNNLIKSEFFMHKINKNLVLNMSANYIQESSFYISFNEIGCFMN